MMFTATIVLFAAVAGTVVAWRLEDSIPSEWDAIGEAFERLDALSLD